MRSGDPSKALILANLDRAAAFGTGSGKIAGNYCSTLVPSLFAKKAGYTILLFLDSVLHQFVEEFSTSNFIALYTDSETGQKVYVTPKSGSILDSVTNRSLYEIAERKLGWKCERRPIKWDEIRSGKFQEIAAVGTAVVLTPVGTIDRQIVKNDVDIGNEMFEILSGEKEDPREIEIESVKLTGDSSGVMELYKAIRECQRGDDEDMVKNWGWMWPLDGI